VWPASAATRPLAGLAQDQRGQRDDLADHGAAITDQISTTIQAAIEPTHSERRQISHAPTPVRRRRDG